MKDLIITALGFPQLKKVRGIEVYQEVSSNWASAAIMLSIILHFTGFTTTSWMMLGIHFIIKTIEAVSLLKKFKRVEYIIETCREPEKLPRELDLNRAKVFVGDDGFCAYEFGGVAGLANLNGMKDVT
jgi:hypothetical protein